VTRTGSYPALNVVQVYVAQGQTFTVVSVATTVATTTADIRFAEGLARTGAARLATLG